jgi:hypothetical protein
MERIYKTLAQAMLLAIIWCCVKMVSIVAGFGDAELIALVIWSVLNIYALLKKP